MNPASLYITAAAAVELSIAAMLLGVSTAPGWRGARRLAFLAFTAGLYSSLNLVFAVDAPAIAVRWAGRVNFVLAAAHVSLWILHTGVREDQEAVDLPWWKQTLCATLLAAGALALVPGWAASDTLRVVRLGDFWWQVPAPGPLMPAIGAFLVGSLLVPGGVFWARTRLGVRDARLMLAAFGVFFACTIVELLATMGSVELPFAAEAARSRLALGDATGARALEDALDGARRIGRVVNELRAYARPGDEITDVKARVSLELVIRDAIAVASSEIRHRAHVEHGLEADVSLRCSPVRLTQVLVNLLMNAGEAMPERGPAGSIRVRSFVGPSGDVTIGSPTTGAGSRQRTCRGSSSPISRPAGKRAAGSASSSSEGSPRASVGGSSSRAPSGSARPRASCSRPPSPPPSRRRRRPCRTPRGASCSSTTSRWWPARSPGCSATARWWSPTAAPKPWGSWTATTPSTRSCATS